MAHADPKVGERAEGTNQAIQGHREPLLKTKLFIPPVRSRRVDRSGLISRMNGSLDKRLTLLSAPAGFGKTTMLAQWVAQAELPVAWLSLDAGDNDPHRFLGYVIEALNVALADGEAAICATAHSMLQSVQPLPVQTVLVALINDLTNISQPFALVLDDYQFITSPAVNEALTFILDHVPSHVHLVIASRVDPSIPLHRLRAAQRLLEVRTEDLRFSVDETGAFMNTVMEIPLSEQDISTLNGRTEGWIVGLQMAALSMQGLTDYSAFIHDFSGSHRYILEYLIEEVLNRQTEDLQTFLLQTSVLDQLCAPLCDAVLGEPCNSQATLEYLNRSNLFLTPLDQLGYWYRYHHLFADLLHARLLQSRADLVPVLHSRAAAWFKQKGRRVEAVNHAVTAGDIELVESLVEGRTLALMDKEEWDRLGKWLDSLSTAMVFRRPWLCIARAWILISTGLLAPAETYLQHAEAGQQALARQKELIESERLAGYIATLRAYMAILRSDAAPALKFARQALRDLPKSDLSVRTLAARAVAMPLRFGGDIFGADEVLSEVASDALRGGDSLAATMLMADQVLHQIVQGKLHQAYAISQQAIQIAEEYKHQHGCQLPAIAYVYPHLSQVLLEWNDLPGAVNYAQSGIELCREWGSFEPLAENYAALAMTLLASQEPQKALNAIQRAEQAASKLSGWHVEIVRQHKVRILLTVGDGAEVQEWMQRRGPKVDEPLNSKDFPANCLFVRALMSLKQYEAAQSILERLLKSSNENRIENGYLLEAMVLAATTFEALARRGQGLAYLERAIKLAEPEGYIRIFVNEGKLMETMLQAYNKRGEGSMRVYTQRLWEGFHTLTSETVEIPPPTRPLLPLVEPLTRREIEVLHLLAAGLSNREIAERLYLSEGTVKTHTHNLYAKLGVQSRTRAIARARELNLI